MKTVTEQKEKVKKSFRKYTNKITSILKRNELRILPGQLAFSFVLSFFPIITLIGTICSLFSISLNDILNFLNDVVPDDVYNMLQPMLEGQAAPKGANIIYLIIGFIAVSHGTEAIILSSNTLYNIKNSNIVVRYVKSFFLAIILMILVLITLVLLAFGDVLFKYLMDVKVLTNVMTNIYWIFSLFKWPVTFIIMYNLIKVLYVASPDRYISFKHVKKGALFTSLGWIIVTAIYSFYSNNIANYDLFYGGISNIIILMMWLYIIAYIFVIGIAINTNEYLEEIGSNNK